MTTIPSTDCFRSLVHRIADAHCHPNDAFGGVDPERAGAEIGGLQVGQLCVMSSSLASQSVTQTLFTLHPAKITPAFGLHPWFSPSVSFSASLDRLTHYHELFGPGAADEQWLSDRLEWLPSPVDFAKFVAELRTRLEAEPRCLLGEVGLDKAFRFQVTGPDGQIQRSRLKIPLKHQIAVLEAQLDLAVELSRNVSLHGVQCQDEVIQVLERLERRWGTQMTGPKPLSKRQAQALARDSADQRAAQDHRGIHICWHSAFISVQVLQRTLKLFPQTVYFSYAIVLFEGRNLTKLDALLQHTPDDRLLVESDWGSEPGMIDEKICQILQTIARVKGWTPERCVDQLEANWKRFCKTE